MQFSALLPQLSAHSAVSRATFVGKSPPELQAELRLLWKTSGAANVNGDLLNLSAQERENLGIDIDALVMSMPSAGNLSICGLPAIVEIFGSCRLLAKARILESLILGDRAEVAERLLRSLGGNSPDVSPLRSVLAVYCAARSYEYENGRKLAARCQFPESHSSLYTVVFRYLAFEFLDRKGSDEILLKAGTAISEDLRTGYFAYIARLNSQQCPSCVSSGPLARSFGLLSMLEAIREDMSVRLLPDVPLFILSTIQQISDWHVKRALFAFLKYCLQSGYTSDIEATTQTLSDMIIHSRSAAAIRLINSTEFGSSTVLTGSQFRVFIRLIVSAKSYEDMLSVAKRVRTLFDEWLTNEMRLELERFLAPRTDSTVPSTQTLPSEIRVTYTSKRVLLEDTARIAVCLSGQLRSFSSNWQSIYRKIVQPLGADVFISTWPEVGFGLGYLNSIDRLLPPEITRLLPVELTSASNFFSLFRSLHAELLKFPATSAQVLENAIGVSQWRILDESTVDAYSSERFSNDPFRNANQIKMLLGMCDSYLLAADAADYAGREYDVVVRMRPDVDVHEFGAIGLLTSVADKETVYVSHNHQLGVSDQFAFGAQKAMAVYMSAIRPVHDSRKFKISQFAVGVGAEALMLDNLAMNKIRCKTAHVVDYKLSSQVLTYHHILTSMLRDLEHCGNEFSALRRSLSAAIS